MSFSGKYRFSRRLENLVASIQKATERKPSTLETNFLYIKCLWRPYLCNDDQKIWHFLSWGCQGDKNLGFWWYFEVQVTFLTAGIPQPHQTCRKGVCWCFTTSHWISSQHFDRKVLFGKKIEISTRCPRSFQAVFLAITSQPLRLAAFPRPLKLQNSS